MSVSIRKCSFCREPGFSVEKTVAVNPYYSYNVRIVTNPINLQPDTYLDIEESFVCPVCGNINVNTYAFQPTVEDLHYFVDKKLEREEK
jgi:hypothetical protein